MRRSLSLACALGALAPASLAAQQLAGSARGAGMADAYGAVARGAVAARYNPANLGLPGNPGFNLQLPTAVVSAGTAPITLGDVAPYSDEVVPDSVKRAWLDRIPAGGALRADVSAAVPAFGLSVGPLAVTVGTVAQSTVRLPREAVELLLFGNADAAGNARAFAMRDGRADGFVASVAAVSLGRPILTRGGGGSGAGRHVLAVGVTGKYVVGQGLLALRGAAGEVSTDPLVAEVSLPTVTVNWRRDGWTRSHGWGVDAGVAYQGPALALGLAVTDLTNNFRWSLEDARVVDGRAAFTQDSSSSEFVSRRLDDPAVSDSMRQATAALLGRAVFRPAARLSAAYRPARAVLLTADVVHRLAREGELQAGAPTTLSVGAELRPLGGVLPLRGGFSLLEGGSAWTVGSGLELGSALSVNVAYGRQSAAVTTSTLAAGVSVGGGR